METKSTDLSSPSEPVARQPILLIWICAEGRGPEPAQCEFWKNWSLEHQQEVDHRSLMWVPRAALPSLEQGPVSESESPVAAVIRMTDWGQTLNGFASERPWKGVIILPAWQNPQNLSQEIVDAMGSTDLDGVTFYREGGKAPFPIWIWRTLVTRPISFLLEIPWTPDQDWLGWKNWFWEMAGAWVFGVKNRDPLFPCRAFQGSFFRQIALQSQSGWVWMEMLAKLHFLGARLSERRLPDPGREISAISGTIDWKDVNQVLRKPQFLPASEP